MISQAVTADSTTRNFTYFYDRVNRLKTAGEGTAWSRTFGCDGFANMWVASWTGPEPDSFTPKSATAFDANNRLLVLASSYDASGNQNRIGDYTSSYDGENRLKTSTINGVTTTYSYDGDGRRVKKVNSSETTVYVYDAQGQLAAEYSSRAPEEPCATCYLVADHLGSTRAILKENGEVWRLYDYYPFGEEIRQGVGGRGDKYSAAGATAGLRFTGKERDGESGLDYFGARYFSGAQGRFVSPDPLKWLGWQEGSDSEQNHFNNYIGDPQNLNLYGYVRNNPLRLTDPNGMYWCTGTKQQCAAFQVGLVQVRAALKSANLSYAQRNDLRRVLSFLGPAQKANGVVVRFGALPKGSAGATVTSKNLDGSILTTITLATSFVGKRVESRAEIGIHEGRHGVMGAARGRDPSTRAEFIATERSAYRTQSYVPQGLGIVSAWGLWDPAAEKNRAAAIEKNAQESTELDCRAIGGCKP